MPAAELRDRGIFATRQLAKRQLTWLKSMEGIDGHDCLEAGLEATLLARIERFLAAGAA